MKSKLSKKEKTFCRSFISNGSMREAAIAAGYTENPQSAGEELICKNHITEELERLSALQRKAMSHTAAVGYRRLAFGGISDAVSLLYLVEPTSEDIAKLDLFSVSEIKKPKDGSMEIKFFDRLKALEKLETALPPEDKAKSLIEALSAGAKMISDEENRAYGET